MLCKRSLKNVQRGKEWIKKNLFVGRRLAKLYKVCRADYPSAHTQIHTQTGKNSNSRQHQGCAKNEPTMIKNT